MLRYLDNSQSAGPNSRVVARERVRSARAGEPPRVSGLNENLAREVLELHTLGAESARAGIYTQGDVTAFARVLTGWRVGQDGADAALPLRRELARAGAKSVLGRRYPEGPEALRLVLQDLALHPATARFVCTKLARHVVADEPPPALVEALARLAALRRRPAGRVSRAGAPSAAWDAAPRKLKTPEEFVISAVRVLRVEGRFLERTDGLGINALGQRAPGGAVASGLERPCRRLARARRGLEAHRMVDAHRRSHGPQHRRARAGAGQSGAAPGRGVAHPDRTRRRRSSGPGAAADGAGVPAPLRPRRNLT